MKMIHAGEKFNPHTASNPLFNSKVKRFTKKCLIESQNKKVRTGTHHMLDAYLTRV